MYAELLRPSPYQVPWLRVFVEGVVIVGSILLAFGIQAWWDERQERIEERGIIERLISDVQADIQGIGSGLSVLPRKEQAPVTRQLRA